ncbi:MAG: DUF2189 domain-containing protein [Alphaproteobacteria bacterium]
MTTKRPADDHGPWRDPQGVPRVRAATRDDLVSALRAGWDDFRAMPAYGLSVGVLYMLGGWLALAAFEAQEWRGLTFPVVAGFALVGPFCVVILYEISRRRERGLPFGWRDAGDMIRATGRRQIMFLGFILMFWLAVWSRVGTVVYFVHFGLHPAPFWELLPEFVSTARGISFVIVGHAFGAMFAAVAFSISVVAFPFLLDRDADFITAMVTSFRTVRASPLVMLGWAVFIGAALAVASAPLFIGLPLVLPLLGHASWHLYRRLVAEG